MISKIALVLALAFSPLISIGGDLSDNAHLADMFKEDQAARKARPIDWAKVGPMDKLHHDEVLALLRAGNVRTANDFYHAAMIMQHGETTEDYQLAYSLSQLSATLDPSNKRARWLSAASWDRILMSKNVPQWYGTQYRKPSPDAPTELYPVADSVISDEERAEMNVPSLQQAKDFLQEINK
ncbi:hypothetical protein [Thermomonas brevis]